MKTGTINFWTPSAAAIYEHVAKDLVFTELTETKNYKTAKDFWIGLQPTVDIMKPLYVEPMSSAYYNKRHQEWSTRLEQDKNMPNCVLRKCMRTHCIGRMAQAVSMRFSNNEILSEYQALAAEHMPKNFKTFKEIIEYIGEENEFDFRRDCVGTISLDVAEIYYGSHECKNYNTHTDLKNIDAAMKNVFK